MVLFLTRALRPVEVGLEVLPPHVFERRAALGVEEELKSRRHAVGL